MNSFGPIPSWNAPLRVKLFVFALIIGVTLLIPRSQSKIRNVILFAMMIAVTTLILFLSRYF